MCRKKKEKEKRKKEKKKRETENVPQIQLTPNGRKIYKPTILQNQQMQAQYA